MSERSVAYVYGGTHKVYLIRNTVRNYIGHNQWLWLRGVCDYEKFVHKIRSINFGTFSIWLCVCVYLLTLFSQCSHTIHMDGAIWINVCRPKCEPIASILSATDGRRIRQWRERDFCVYLQMRMPKRLDANTREANWKNEISRRRYRRTLSRSFVLNYLYLCIVLCVRPSCHAIRCVRTYKI